ncbi:MAG: hypothetical protein ACRD6N_04305 [Pyrinomonadaceae bacterium]
MEIGNRQCPKGTTGNRVVEAYDFAKLTPMKARFLPLILLWILIPVPQRSVVVRPDLSGPKRLAEWTLDGSGSWDIAEGKLVLAKAGTPAGNIRRPAALAILKSELLRRVTIEAQIRSTAPVDVLRRDLDFVVGYQSPTRFYYVHLSGASDDVHNGIFLVADADRRRIDSGGAKPQLNDQNWHRVRVVRDGATGRIEVYVDNSSAPVMTAVDTAIQAGRVGFGSFDDTGEFREIAVTGTR